MVLAAYADDKVTDDKVKIGDQELSISDSEMNKLKTYCQKIPVNGLSFNSTQAHIDLSNKSVPVTDWFNRLGDNAAPDLCRSVLADDNNQP